MNTPAIVVCAFILLLSVLGHFLPRVTRPDMFFGVTVDPAFRTTDPARRMLRDYRIFLWCSAVAAGALLWVVPRPGVAFFIYLIGACCAQVLSHRRALSYAAAPRSTAIEVDLSTPEEKLPGGPLVALLPFVVLIGLGSWAMTHPEMLPDRLAVHWGFNGPDRWVPTLPRTIIGLLAMHAWLCLFLTGAALSVLHWSRRVSSAGPSAAAERRFRRRTGMLMLTAEYFTICPPAFSLLQAPARAMQLWSLALLVILAAFVLSLMRARQVGSRLPAPDEGPIGDRTADDRWFGGIVYFNRSDPALLVERRMGIGWTVNVGNPWVLLPVLAVGAGLAIAPLLLQAGPDSVAGQSSQQDDHGASLKGRPASPGTEESLRRYILSLKQGRPDYEEMSPTLAASVRRQLPKIMATMDELGGYESLTFEGTDAAGADIYVATFARGRLEWHIGSLVEGKVAYRYFRRLP